MNNDPQTAAGQQAVNFSEAYFNYHLQRAQKYVTEESEHWISFVASNINEEDLALLNQQAEGATVECIQTLLTSDTTAVSTIQVNHFLQLGAVGTEGQWIESAQFDLQLVQRNSRWKVKMEGPLQSGKQSRD
ncbi:MAG: hypothetical protein IJ710_04045 [Prevotella sp.]|nr:hypothetical protein [Prevotella sp.]